MVCLRVKPQLTTGCLSWPSPHPQQWVGMGSWHDAWPGVLHDADPVPPQIRRGLRRNMYERNHNVSLTP